jgi:hypothetical protein
MEAAEAPTAAPARLRTDRRSSFGSVESTFSLFMLFSSVADLSRSGSGVDTETLAGFGLAAMMANDNDLIRSPPIPV